MPKRSTDGRNVNQDTAAVVAEARRLREILRLRKKELQAELELARRLHKQYPWGGLG